MTEEKVKQRPQQNKTVFFFFKTLQASKMMSSINSNGVGVANGGGGNNVVLHVYEFNPDPSQHDGPVSTTDRALCTLSGILPVIGMGAYHTSLEVMDLKYTFAGGAGVMVGRSNGPDVGVPNGANYKQAINIGQSARTKEELQEIVKRLSLLFFTPASYHLVHRNCNHFTEVLAMALILQEPKARLPSFPKWLNRLANTGAMVVTAEEGIAPCDTVQEARLAAGY